MGYGLEEMHQQVSGAQHVGERLSNAPGNYGVQQAQGVDFRVV